MDNEKQNACSTCCIRHALRHADGTGSGRAGIQKGDVNMDGEIGADDAQLALIEYTYYAVAMGPHTLTAEQIALADVDGYTPANKEPDSVMLEDAWII